MISYLLGVVISLSAAELVRNDATRPSFLDFECHVACIYSLDDSWRTKDHQPIKNRLTKQTPKKILLHHTGTKQKDKPIDEILRKLYNYSIRHTSVGKTSKTAWGDVPYHFYIDRNANMMGARPVEYAPDTNTNFDTDGFINIVVDGNYTAEGGDVMTRAQKRVLKRLIADLKKAYKIESVHTHKEVAHGQTECPGNISAE